MLKKIITGCGVGLFSLLAALPINAQEVATLVLSDGQRPAGELLELDARGYTLRVNGKDQVFPANRVASIEFVVAAPAPAIKARVDAGESLLVLRNGQVIPGRLVDIGGTRPKRLTVDTPSGQRDFMSNTVAQVYLFPVKGTGAGTAAVLAPPAVSAGAIVVPGNQPWTNAGIAVMRRELISITASGDIMIAATASSGVGGSSAVTNPKIRYPVPGLPVGALIARIDNGTPFEIGTKTEVFMPAAGQLFLGINDDNLADNSGAYTVKLKRLAP